PGRPNEADDGFTRIALDLPIAEAKAVTAHLMTGPYDAHDVGAERVKIERVELGPRADLSSVVLDHGMGLDKRGLAPGSAAVFIFEID
ncbi:MAG: hypothetical protein AAF360_05215, partial [Pseudomonadota bacterium]